MNSDPTEIVASLANRITQNVLAVLGESNVLSIFIGGSLARGEIACFVRSGFVELYSDLDFFVVVTDDVELDAGRKTVRQLVRGLPLEGAGFRLYRLPDVGVYSMADLLGQPSRPGTVDIAGAHRVVYGSSDIPKKTAAFETSKIDVTEALYLIENRLLEGAGVLDGLEQDRSGGAERFGHYVTLKNCLDAAAAVLIAKGRYVSSREERMAILGELRASVEFRELLPDGAWNLMEQAHREVMDLQHALESGRDRFASFRGQVEGLLLGSWIRIARSLPGNEGKSWPALVRRRCREWDLAANGREVAILARRMSISRPKGLFLAGRLSRLAPVAALRLSGLVETLMRHRGHGRFPEAFDTAYCGAVDRLTRAFGYFEGSLFRRSREMFREVA